MSSWAARSTSPTTTTASTAASIPIAPPCGQPSAPNDRRVLLREAARLHIIKRLPVRYTFDNRYQGIPVGGYNKLTEALLDGIEVRTGVDFLKDRAAYQAMAKKIVYTGSIDEYFGYKLGQLEYRGLRFETERLEEENHQGVAVVNYTEREIPYTRIIEHKHFEFGTQPVTYVTREYPADWHPGEEAYYPVNNERNQSLYQQYEVLAKQEPNTIFGGRLAEYKYYDMDDVIKSALERVQFLRD